MLESISSVLGQLNAQWTLCLRSVFAAFVGIIALGLAPSARAQVPKVYLKFDGNLTDASSAALITSVTPSTGFTPTYTTDRFNQAGRALVMPGGASLQLLASTLPGNSNQALGLRNSTGATTTPFTLSAWMYVTTSSSSSGYNTIFGNAGSGAGTLHAGLNNNRAHLGFDGNDATGATVTFDAAKWYHVAFVFDGTNQRIYINGVPEITRATTNTLKADDLYIGNWGTNNSAVNDFIGRLDDVAVYGEALPIGKIQALYNGADPTTLASVPAAYSGPKLPGTLGGDGTWGVREIKAYSGIGYSCLVNADRIINGYAVTPSGTVANYTTPVINFTDDEGAGNLGNFDSEGDFATNTPSADDSFLLLAKGAVRIAIEDDYSFGFLGDDGARLRVLNQTFINSAAISGSTGNPAAPAHQGDAIYFPGGTGNSGTIGVVHLKPGDYNLELVYWEGTGGSAIEVFGAKGARTSFDSSFQLIGNPAAGGLPLVRDPDTVPQISSFTVNGGGSLFINNGTPASFTLAWATNSAVLPGVSVAISPSVGAVAQNGTVVVTAPAQTTTYTLTATSGADVKTATVTVYINSPPVITSFTANDTTVTSGAAVTLSWSVDGATGLTLQPGTINVTGLTSKVVNPTTTTTYTLTAINASGLSSQQTLTVTVGPAPVIASFVTVDANPLFGAETALNWNASGFDTLSIDQGIGAVSGATGTVSIVPIQTTTYTLTATNIYGSKTATATVNQPTPIGVASPGFTVRRVSASTPFPFANLGYLASADSLLAGQNVLAGSDVTVSNVASINYSNGADGDFTSGNVDFPGGGSGDNFVVKVTATLVVNTPGAYTFVVNSDDGARLRIDGQDVILDDSTHSPAAASGRVTLTKPTAQLELVYYDATGGAELELGWIRPNQTFQLLGVITPAAAVVRGKVLISEFMADNGSTILDESGAAPDWIEIWNSTTSTVNLSGYYLTDDVTLPNKWALPAWTLGPNKYLVLFASLKDLKPPQALLGQDNAGTLLQPHLHTNFKLSKAGGYLALNQSNGVGGYNAITVFSPYPAQKGDVSYGSSDSEGYIGYMEVATPGAANATSVTDFVQDTVFSVKRGRYSAPFSLTISCATTGATIRYTTDGSSPTSNHGLIYTAPLTISATTVIRAAAFKVGWKPTNVDTNTYLFVDDIVTQNTLSALNAGFPSGAVNGQVFRYGMTVGNVTAGGGTLASLKSALAAAPTVCMTTDMANLVNSSTGIYVNPGKHGLAWERPASMEYINIAGTSEFQIDGGVRIRGGASRAVTNTKHAFHLYFRNGLYGNTLNYRLFGAGGASGYSQIDLRCEENYSWSKDNSSSNTLIREEWSRLTQAEMGQPYGRNLYFHLYINGIYWGVYDFEERTEAVYGETYLGGTKDDIDVVKSAGSPSYNTEMTDGNFIAWRSLFDQCLALKNDTTEAGRTAKYLQMQGLNPDGSRNLNYPVLLDVNNLIDYLLVVFYDGSFDSPMSTFLTNASNNWFCVRDRLGARGFAYFAHDQEHGMDSTNQSYNRVGPWGDPNATGNNWNQTWTTAQYRTRETFSKSNPQYMHELLAFSAEYRQRFADRVQRHFFNGGALTTAKAVARVNTLATQVDPIIHAEAARWGSASLQRNTWVTAKAAVLNFINNGGTYTGAPQTQFAVQPRTSMLTTQLTGYQDPIGTAKTLFPTFLAPAFSGQFGGAVAANYSFSITNPNASGTLYYSVNGVDPRATGGAISAGVLTGSPPQNVVLANTSTVRARIYESSTQTWSPLVEADYLVGTLASASNLVISKIHYNPAGSGDLEEFIELLNIGTTSIDLSKCAFTLGIQFQFPTGMTLAPGARTLVVRDAAAFGVAFPSVPVAQIAGVFANSSSLDNGGERLQLLDSGGAVLRDFSYDNKAPWPVLPDGNGPSLVLKRPQTNPDPADPLNWRASASVGGTPGVADSLSYPAWATANSIADATGTADADHDGLPSLIEYALGTNPAAVSLVSLPSGGTQSLSVNGITGDYLTFTLRRVIGRDDVGTGVEAATSLSGPWSPALPVGTATFNGDGTETLVFRHPLERTGQPQEFLRLKVTRLP